jgi:ubiquinone/menaquinone biosynthesis C-methylase UbiE
MGDMTKDAVAIQRAFYAATAQSYDQAHEADEKNHGFSLAEQFMLSITEFLNIQSILDIGAGTGRVLLGIKKERPDVRAIGIEPSPELRSVGHAKGLLPTQLREGDATRLAFDDGSFDLVCAFGLLHHIATPSSAISEMLRVTRKAIFIVDINNYAVGSKHLTRLKQSIADCRTLASRRTD